MAWRIDMQASIPGVTKHAHRRVTCHGAPVQRLLCGDSLDDDVVDDDRHTARWARSAAVPPRQRRVRIVAHDNEETSVMHPKLAFAPLTALGIRKPVLRTSNVRVSHSRTVPGFVARGQLQTWMSMAPSAEGSRTVQMPKIDERVVEGMRLHEFLALTTDKELAKAVEAMFMACKVVGYEVRTASCNKEECVNAFGDQQLAVDLLADRTIEAALRASGVVAIGSSEEQPIEKDLGGTTFAVAWDPLDGSSIVDTNFSVGTIFGIWRGKRLTGVTGRELEAAGMAVYGPRTSLTVSLNGLPGTHEFLLVDNFSGNHGMWVLVQSFYTINEGKLFAPGNLKATQDNPGYAKLVQYWMENKYQLRYTGGMVPDCNQILIKGKGVFANPGSPSAPAKLRVLYEVAPIAYLIERAGGASSDGERSALDIPIPSTDIRSQICYGSKGEVARFNEMVGKRYIK